LEAPKTVGDETALADFCMVYVSPDTS
jgi:hypothetical protein